MNNTESKIQKLNELYSKYGKGNILYAINQLEDRNKEILIMYFGLNKDSKTPVKEIAQEFDITNAAVYDVINKELIRIEKWAQNPEMCMEALKHSKQYYLRKIYEQYGKEKVLKAINNLSKEDKFIIDSYYGINGENIKTKDTIALMANVSKDMLDKKIKDIMDNIKSEIADESKVRQGRRNSKLNKLYSQYGEQGLIDALEILSPSNRRALELYLGIKCDGPKNAKETSEILGLSKGTVDLMVSKSIEKMTEYLENPEEFNIKPTKTTILNSIYEKYGKEKFMEVINSLDDIEKQIICMYYGVNRKRAMNAKEIMKETGIDKAKINNLISKAISVIKRKLNEDTKVSRLEKKYQNLCAIYGEDNVKLAISALPIKQQEIIKGFKGIECERKTIEDMMTQYGVSEDRMNQMISYCLTEVSDIMMDELPEEIKDFMELYGKKDVKKALVRLSRENKCFLDNFKQNKIDIDNAISDLKEELIDLKEESLNLEELIYVRRENFGKSMLVKNYSKVKEVINKLDNDEKELIKMYYALDGVEVYNIIDLSDKFNVSTSVIRNKIKESIRKINVLVKQEMR